MRTIKFRGKRIDKDVFVFGDMLTGMGDKKGKFYILPHLTYYPGDCNSLDGYEVIRETVGQFTGLCDKNGTEIYEGDIVIFDNHLQGISQVVYDYAGFDVDSKTYRTALRPAMSNHMRVVGNIHDNSSLLKGGAE